MLWHYATQLAKLAGYLLRKGEPPPGNTVMWRGLTWLTDIVLGMQLQLFPSKRDCRCKGERRLPARSA
jgi:hypothetical protein